MEVLSPDRQCQQNIIITDDLSTSGGNWNQMIQPIISVPLGQNYFCAIAIVSRINHNVTIRLSDANEATVFAQVYPTTFKVDFTQKEVYQMNGQSLNFNSNDMSGENGSLVLPAQQTMLVIASNNQNSQNRNAGTLSPQLFQLFYQFSRAASGIPYLAYFSICGLVVYLFF